MSGFDNFEQPAGHSECDDSDPPTQEDSSEPDIDGDEVADTPSDDGNAGGGTRVATSDGTPFSRSDQPFYVPSIQGSSSSEGISLRSCSSLEESRSHDWENELSYNSGSSREAWSEEDTKYGISIRRHVASPDDERCIPYRWANQLIVKDLTIRTGSLELVITTLMTCQKSRNAQNPRVQRHQIERKIRRNKKQLRWRITITTTMELNSEMQRCETKRKGYGASPSG
jgi:hypothetical protein